ncbi:hypothetical protein ACVWY3_000979 [Bradyrhizobium sp. USDA 4486]
MPATETAHEVASFSPAREPVPIAEMVQRAEHSRPCARRDICRSVLCQTNRTGMDCPGSRKGN